GTTAGCAHASPRRAGQVRRHLDRGRGSPGDRGRLASAGGPGGARAPPRGAPEDSPPLPPMPDGGPGFVDVLHAALGGDLVAVTVRGPHDEPTPGAVLLAGHRPWVEKPQAGGVGLV